MASTFTTNKSIEQPASGDYDNTWATPVNADWEIIDTALGGTATITVTGLTPGNQVFSLAQYKPPNIIFTGTIGENMDWYFPAGVGGLWTVRNNTTGAFTLTLLNDTGGGRSVVAPQGTRVFVVSDGTNVDLASTPTTVITPATPTGEVGTAAVTGSTGHYMDAGSAPVINVGISPSWTGVHTFTNTVDFDAGVGVQSSATFNCAGTATFTGTTTISGVLAANYYHGVLGSALITVSTSAPSGGSNGDIWLQIA